MYSVEISTSAEIRTIYVPCMYTVVTCHIISDALIRDFANYPISQYFISLNSQYR